MNAASNVVIGLQDGDKVAEGGDVTVTGTVKLSKSELVAPNFNLIYAPVEEPKLDENGNEVKDDAGNTVMVKVYHYYGDDGNGNTIQSLRCGKRNRCRTRAMANGTAEVFPGG